MACAIQPTVRPRIKIARAVPCGNPNAVVAAASAKSTFDGCGTSCLAAATAASLSGRDAGSAAMAAVNRAAAGGAPADQIGPLLVETPQRGELLMHRIGRGWPVADTGGELVEDRPAGADDPMRRQIERPEIRRGQLGEPHMTTFDQGQRWRSPHPNPPPLAGEGVAGRRRDNPPLFAGEGFWGRY